ncbi:MAG: DUF488 family protein [Pseudomonadota bacterium]
MLQAKRIYNARTHGDGYRVLVDRIWPRGVSKVRAQLDAWMQDIAPSPDLRIWFGHDRKRWPEFKIHYLAELKGVTQSAYLEELKEHALKGRVTLLYAAKDEHHNHALVLLEALQSR